METGPDPGRQLKMRVCMLALLLAVPLGAATQDFATSDRFDMSAESIVRWGHDRWVGWYCDGARRGPGGREGAEKVYCLALYEVTQPVLAQRSKADRAFFGDARSLFADLAKTSFGFGIELTGYSAAWSLPIAESSTAINETIWRMLNRDRAPSAKSSEIWELATKIEGRVHRERPQVRDAGRFRTIAKSIEKHFAHRPEREVMLARDFMLKMGRLALLKP